MSVQAPSPQLMKAKLSQTGLHLSLDWVAACLEWLHSDQPGLSTPRLLLAMQEQWITTDITIEGVMDRPTLPPDLEQARVTKLPPDLVLSLQVQYGYDIGSPAYGQLQKMHQVDVTNVAVSMDDTQSSQAGYQASQGGRQQAAWEPKPSRVMMLTLTDGFQTVQAMEHETLACLPDRLTPGLKVQVSGPLVCRRGILLLTKNCLRVLGGGVEELSDEFGLEKILSEKIGKKDVGQMGNRFAVGDATRPPAREITIEPPRPGLPAGNPPQPPQPAPPPELDDDDDELLLAASQSVDFSEALSSTQRPPDRVHRPPNVAVVQPLNSNIVRCQPLVPLSRGANEKVQSPLPLNRGIGDKIQSSGPLNREVNNDKIQSSIPVNRGRPEIKVQSSITNYIRPSNSGTVDPPLDFDPAPSFDLDMDFDDDFPVEEFEPPALSKEPFTYLSLLKSAVTADPKRTLTVVVKVVSATLSSKMSMRRTPAGPQWHVGLVLNDGSASICADLASSLLDRLIGPAREYVLLGQDRAQEKGAFKERMKGLSGMLASLSALLTIVVEPALEPVITKIEEVSGLHLAQMRKRRLVN